MRYSSQKGRKNRNSVPVVTYRRLSEEMSLFSTRLKHLISAMLPHSFSCFRIAHRCSFFSLSRTNFLLVRSRLFDGVQ